MAYPTLASPSKLQQAAFATDLSVDLICPDCRDPTPIIIKELSSGDLVCGNCGLVPGDRVVDTRSEWRVRLTSRFISYSCDCASFRLSRMTKATTLLVSVPLPTLLWRARNSSTPPLASRTVARASRRSFSAQQRAHRVHAPSGTCSPRFVTSPAGVTSSHYPRRSATLRDNCTCAQTRRNCSGGNRSTPSSQRAYLLRADRHICRARSAKYATSRMCQRRFSDSATRLSSRPSTLLPDPQDVLAPLAQRDQKIFWYATVTTSICHRTSRRYARTSLLLRESMASRTDEAPYRL